MNKKSRNQIEIRCATTTAVSMALAIYFSASAEVLANSADYRFLIDSDWHNCQQISPTYQEVYAFETKSFYINICQKDNIYFYSGEAKQSEVPSQKNTALSEGASFGALRSSIFLPAYPLKDRRGFKAENGNVSYVVVLPFSKHNLNSPGEAILTIKRNGQLVAVESSLNKYCQQSPIANAKLAEGIAPENIEPNMDSHDRLATIPLQQDIGWNLSKIEPLDILPVEIFNSNSHLDFYRIDGKLHSLTTCN